MTHTPFALSALMAALLLAVAAPAGASSHREAPFITTSPKVDGTDFYMFRSYEGVAASGSGGRSDYVTLLANYQHRERGGDGYMRLLEFDPAANHVRVCSYSPAIDAMRCADAEERIDLPL